MPLSCDTGTEGGDPLRFPAELVRALDHVARAVAAGRVAHVPRRSRQEQMDALGLRAEETIRIVASLEIKDFHAGPDADHHRPDRTVWIFGPTVNGCQAYVKLALGFSDPEGDPIALLWSLHPARFPMELPLRHL